MSTAGTITVVVACVLVGAAVALALRSRSAFGGRGVRRRFGPEYDRVLARHDGDRRAARAELAARLARYRDPAPRPPAEADRERYLARWAGVQARFVEDPVAAVAGADELLTDLLCERGYPAEDFGALTDALSVHHPHHVQRYRDSHALVAAERAFDTEELRVGLVRSREVLDELLTAAPREPARHRHAAARRHRYA